MSRLMMSSALPAEYAERVSDVDPYISAKMQDAIERRADELLEERLYGDLTRFSDLLGAIHPREYEPQLQRALANLDRACKGELIALQAITTALSEIQTTFWAEAERVWIDELREEATAEILGVEE